MDTPDINKIKAMPREDLEVLNRRLAGKFAAHMVGMLFIKLAVSGVSQVLLKKAIIEAAKRV